jgi:hypothetical protein
MLISFLMCRTVRLTALSIVVLVCFLPYWGDLSSAQNLSLFSLPSELMEDGEEATLSDPTTASTPAQDCGLIQPFSWSHARFGQGVRAGENPAGQGTSTAALYRLTSRPPPCAG